MRALDVATMNGFWAFEMERRGAREVIALDVEKLGDLDISPVARPRMTAEEKAASAGGPGFFCAREILGSKVERRTLNVYNLSPDTASKFDFVFVGDLLLHLMNPVQAVANICQVTSGVAHIVDCFSPYLPKMTMQYLGAEQGTWWGISLTALRPACDQRLAHVAAAACPAPLLSLSANMISRSTPGRTGRAEKTRCGQEASAAAESSGARATRKALDRPQKPAADATANPANPATNSRRRPNRSAARPPKTRSPPKVMA